MDIEWIISECAARNHSADFDQDFRFAIWPASMVHSTDSVGAFFHSFHPERLRQPRKGGPALPPPGTENPKVPHTKRFLIPLSVSPLPFALFACPPPRPIRSAGAAPQSAAPCFQRAAESDDSLPV